MGADFHKHLRRIEYQAARLAENPRVNLNWISERDLMCEKSTDLMTGVVKFFNSALLCFSQDFARKSLNFEVNISEIL